MTRLQILELPEGANDDRPPFLLVVDEYEPQRYILGIGDDQAQPVDMFEGVAEKIGARAVLVFEETIDIPANDTSAYLPANEPPLGLDEEFKGRVQRWAEGTNETLARIVDAISHPHPKRGERQTPGTDGQRLADERTEIAIDQGEEH